MEHGIRQGYESQRELREQSAVGVAILLCTYHGQHYLAEQLDSFAAQTYLNWSVWASDDGSTDDTHAILGSYIAEWGSERLSVHSGPREGFAANFLSLTCHASIKADYYAYADQDDIWEPDKLNRAIDWLRTVPSSTPALYCTRTRVVDADNHEIGFSPLFKKTLGFVNALVQNVAGGNTMVFNDAARKLLREAGEDIDVVIHDWWVYLVVSGCGGKVYYDPHPSVRYRQHASNLIGENSAWSDRLARLRGYWNGQFSRWNDRNIQSLQTVWEKLTPANQDTLRQFTAARKRWLIPRLLGIMRSGVYRQTTLGNLTLFVAAILGKI